MLAGILNRYARDERGNFAMVFACSTTVMLGVAGAAMDMRMASNAQSTAQQMSDALALNAAVYVSNKAVVPDGKSDQGLPPGRHSAASLDLDFPGMVEGGADNVIVNVQYDDPRKQVTVSITGNTETTLSRVLGKERIPFEGSATVSYMDIKNATPASIALVLDNSGSMGWDDKLALNVRTEQYDQKYWDCDNNGNNCQIKTRKATRYIGNHPPGAKSRIDGLRTSVNEFSNELKTRISPTETDRRIIRMGMLPYSTETIVDNTVSMDFGYLSTGQVGKMRPGGSTNSHPPMQTALEWMKTEDKAHKDEANRTDNDKTDPLKFVVLMSDGENTVGSWRWRSDSSANTYYDIRSWNVYTIADTMIFKDEYNKADYPNHVPGHLRRRTDELTLDSCKTMRDKHDVEIFTIAFALKEGHYNMRNPNNDATYYLSDWKVNNATNMLAGCASSSEHFLEADNVEELEAAFSQIQNAIAEEIIRIEK